MREAACTPVGLAAQLGYIYSDNTFSFFKSRREQEDGRQKMVVGNVLASALLLVVLECGITAGAASKKVFFPALDKAQRAEASVFRLGECLGVSAPAALTGG